MRSLRIVLALAALAACSHEQFEPPPRTTEIAAEEKRVASLLEQRGRRGGPAQEGRCAVRILGMDAPTTYAWSTCEFRDASGMPSGTSGPVRVDGTDIRSPADGAGYDDSVRELFPADMADAIFEDQNSLQPDTE